MSKSKRKSHTVMKASTDDDKHNVLSSNHTKVDNTSYAKCSVRERAKMYEKYINQKNAAKEHKTTRHHSVKGIYKTVESGSNKNDNLVDDSGPSTSSKVKRLRFVNKPDHSPKYQGSNFSTYSVDNKKKSVKLGPNTSYVVQSTLSKLSKFPNKNNMPVPPMKPNTITKKSIRAKTAKEDKKSCDLTLNDKCTKTEAKKVSKATDQVPLPKILKTRSKVSLYVPDNHNQNNAKSVMTSTVEKDSLNSSNLGQTKSIEKIKTLPISNNIRSKQEQIANELQQSNNEQKNSFGIDENSSNCNNDEFKNLNIRQKIESFNNLWKLPSPDLSNSINKIKCVKQQKQTIINDERYAKYFGIKPSNEENKNSMQSSNLTTARNQVDKFKQIDSTHSNNSYITAHGSKMSSESSAKQEILSNLESVYRESNSVLMKYDDLKPISTFNEIIVTKEELLSADADFNSLFQKMKFLKKDERK